MSSNIQQTATGASLSQMGSTGQKAATSKVIPFVHRHPKRDWPQPTPGTSVQSTLANTLTDAIAQAQLDNRLGALAIVRLNDFSAFTEGFGYHISQQLSALFQHRLNNGLRDGDFFQALGEDEFALLLNGVEQASELDIILERVLARATGSYHLEDLRFHLSADAGVARFPLDTKNPDQLLRYARMALHQTHTADDLSSFRFFSQEILMQVQNRMTVIAEVRDALADNRLVLHYQPQYDLANGRIIAAEALLRYQDEQGRLVPPACFIDVIEETALIINVGHWVIQEACRQLRSWRDNGLPLERVTINLAPRQLMDDNLLPVIHTALNANGLRFSDLEIEITERQMIDHLPLVIDTLNELGSLGMRVAMDDFGTGYSSLAYLSRLPLHLLKIDRSFLQHCHSGQKSTQVVAAIIAMAQALGLEVIAEGIERPEQEQGLRRLGCQLGQGFLFSRPIAAAEFASLLQSAVRIRV